MDDIKVRKKAKHKLTNKSGEPFVIQLAKTETELEKSQQQQFLKALSGMTLNVKLENNLFIPVEIRDSDGVTLNHSYLRHQGQKPKSS